LIFIQDRKPTPNSIADGEAVMDTSTDKQRWTLQYPEMGAGPIDLSSMTDSDVYDREVEKIYRKAWLNIGRAEQIPNVGDFFVFTIPTFDLPVLVVRGRDHKVRAFHNVCSHRQFPVTLAAKGNCKNRFVCRMHAWSYDSQGALVVANGEDRFVGLDKRENGLTPIHCGVWHGFICVNLDAEPEQSIESYFSEVDEYFAEYPFHEMEPLYEYSSNDYANWKTVLHAQNEFWHVPFLHKETIARDVLGKSSIVEPNNIRLMGLHRAAGISGPANPKAPAPAAEIAARYGAGTIFAEMATSKATGGIQRYRLGRDFGEAAVFTLFPNFHVSFFETSYMLFRYWPVSVGKTIWEFLGYGAKRRAENAGQLFANQYTDILQRDTYREDAGAHALIQRNLKNGAKKRAHLHDSELQLRHLSFTVDKKLASA
jgi:phenylpropionate dioxygenase-like ring-hydroxylating dioxygenase large terminal subunit